ncbi:MAG: purine-nucleoside phosphorylase [Acidobacteriota bacterium]
MNEPSHTGELSAEQAIDRGVARYDALGWPRPDALVVSGSGLAVDLGEVVYGPQPLTRLLPFEVAAIEGHPLSIELLQPAPERHVLYVRGRLHSYQGFDAHQTVFMTRLGWFLGARALLMTNAAGGLRRGLAPGDLVVVEDHLNLIGMNPLRGALPAAWGPQFPDMTQAYDPALRALARHHGEELGIELTSGTYAGLPGPSYETPAEVRMLRALGADLVGMSSVLEVIAANHLGCRCFVMSLVTNAAAGDTGEALDHDEVVEAGKVAARDVSRLLAAMIADPDLIPG